MYRQAQQFIKDHESMTTNVSITIGFIAMALLHSYGPTKEYTCFTQSLVNIGVGLVCLKVSDYMKERDPNDPVIEIIKGGGFGALFQGVVSITSHVINEPNQIKFTQQQNH